MKFKSVQINNFGAIGEAEIELDNRGLILVQGENATNSAANSNGAGKSTIVEAISWVLFGKTAKGQTGDAVINRTAGKDCSVSLVLDDDNGDQYLIQRGRKDKVLKSNAHVTLTDGANVHDLTKGTDKLTQEVIEQIIGCPYEVFIGAVYSGQEQMPDLPNMTDKYLKLLIEEAAGITLLDKAHVIARGRLNDQKSKLEQVERDAERASMKQTSANDRLIDAKSSVNRWNAQRDARIIDHETKVRILLRDAKADKKHLSDLKPKADLLKELNRIKGKLGKLDTEKAELERLEDIKNKAEKEATRAKTMADTQVTGVKSLKQKAEKIQDQIGQPCTSCGRPHDTDTLDLAIGNADKDLAEAKKSARECIESYKAASQSAQSASQSASKFKDSMTDMSVAIALSEDISNQLEKVREVRRHYDDCMLRANEGIEEINKEKMVENPEVRNVADREDDLKQAIIAHKKIKDSLKPAQTAVNVARDVVEVYSPKGVRAHILDTVTPYLNERTAHYLGALTDGEFEAIWQTLTLTAKGEARENFSIQVTGSDGAGAFADLSGGEKRKVRIACALALQDLVATRATKSLDLFIADEIDAALDTAALERLMGVLDEKAKERGSVFIISHSDLRDWCSNTMTIIKENGVARVAA